MCLKTRMTAYEGVKVSRQSIYHNINTLKQILNPKLVLGQIKEKNFKVVKGGNATLVLKIANILDNRIKFNKALKGLDKSNDQVILKFTD